MRLFLATLSFLWSYGAADYTDCDVASCSCLGISLSVLKSTGGAQTLFQEGGGDDPSSFLLSLCDPMSAADLAGCQNTSVSTSFLRKANPKATGKPKCTYLGDTDSMQAEYAVSAEGVPALQVQYSHLNGTGSGDAGLSRVVITFTESPPNATQGPSNVTQVNDTYYTLEWRGLPNAPVAPTPPPPAPVHGYNCINTFGQYSCAKADDTTGNGTYPTNGSCVTACHQPRIHGYICKTSFHQYSCIKSSPMNGNGTYGTQGLCEAACKEPEPAKKPEPKKSHLGIYLGILAVAVVIACCVGYCLCSRFCSHPDDPLQTALNDAINKDGLDEPNMASW